MRSLILLSLAAASFLAKQDMASLDQELKERPVTKVINLLKDMQANLEKEGAMDQEIFDKLSCWCETNDKEKTSALAEAERRINALESDIEMYTSKSARLNGEIASLNDEVEKNTAALNKAAAIRTKELAEFTSEEKDMMASIQGLKNAVTVLGKHHADPEALINLATVLKHHMFMHDAIISPSQKKAVTAFIQGGIQQPAGFQSYAPASGQIFGILKQMKETFEGNLSTSQKEELTAQAEFAALKAAKTAEITAAKKQVDNKSVELADTDEANAQAKEDLSDTRSALDADTTFLLNLKQKCKESDAEMEARTKARQEEISACSEAISILSSDDAHDTFGKTLGFVQVEAVLNQEKATRRKAVNMLKEIAKKTGSAEIAVLATAAQLDAFTKVIAAIDEMVSALTKEKADEITHRDFCIEELHQNEKSTLVAKDQKADLTASIETLASTIDTLTKDLAGLHASIAEMNVQVKRASEDRELENKEFQQTIADQRATQQILQKALARLQVVYGSFVQTKAKATQEPGAAAPPPPAGFETYNKQGGAGGVLGMIQNVINDAKAMENEALRDENSSQKAYESFVKNTNGSIVAAQKEIVNKSENKARAEQAHAQAEADFKATMSDLEKLSVMAAELHKSCDYVMDNFEVRQTARDQEVEALRQAKAVLSGANFQ